MVPHLTTALPGPLLDLERRFLENSTAIEHWLRGQWQEHTPPFYSSCDLRNSWVLLAPVDTNPFPAASTTPTRPFALCVQAAMAAIENLPGRRRHPAHPGNHTRNVFTCKTSPSWPPSSPAPASTCASARSCPKSRRRRRSTCQRPDPGPRTLEAHWTALASKVSTPVPYLLNNDISAGIPRSSPASTTSSSSRRSRRLGTPAQIQPRRGIRRGGQQFGGPSASTRGASTSLSVCR